MTKINWGIIGLGSTTSRFLKGLSLLNDGNFYAIASRTAEKIEKIKENYTEVDSKSDEYKELFKT